MNSSKTNVANGGQPRLASGTNEGYPVPHSSINMTNAKAGIIRNGQYQDEWSSQSFPTASMPKKGQRDLVNSNPACAYQDRPTRADGNGLGYSDGNGPRSSGIKLDVTCKRAHATSDNCSCGGRNEATKDSGKAKSADAPFYSDEDLELAIRAPLTISYLRSDGWSERICVPKGLAKKYSRYFARYVHDDDEPQELNWSDLWSNYLRDGKTGGGLVSGDQLSRHGNGDSDVPQRSGLYRTQPYESRRLEQGQVIQPRAGDTNQRPGNATTSSQTLVPPEGGSKCLAQEGCIVKAEENPLTKHQETDQLDSEGHGSVLREDVVVQYRGSSIKVEKGEIVCSPEFPGYQKNELCRGTPVHQSSQEPCVSEAQDCHICLPKNIEQRILEGIQGAGIIVFGMDLSGTLKDVIAREGRKQHIEELLKHQEFMKDDLWEVFKIFFKWIVSRRIVRKPYSRTNSTTGTNSVLDLGDVLWHGRMFLSKEFTTTLHRTIKLEGGSLTHRLNPSRLDTIKLAKSMYDSLAEEYFVSVRESLVARTRDAVKQCEAEKRAQEARDEEAEKAVGPNLDAALAIDENERILPSMAREMIINRESPGCPRTVGTVHTDVAPLQLRLPIIGANYGIDIPQGSGTWQATLATNKPRAQHTSRDSHPSRAYRRGDSYVSRSRHHSPDYNHRRGRRPARPLRNNGTRQSTEDSCSHHRRSNARDPPQRNPEPGRVRREDKYSDNEY